MAAEIAETQGFDFSLNPGILMQAAAKNYKAKRDAQKNALMGMSLGRHGRLGAANILTKTLHTSQEHESEPEHLALLTEHGRNIFQILGQGTGHLRAGFHQAKTKTEEKMAKKGAAATQESKGKPAKSAPTDAAKDADSEGGVGFAKFSERKTPGNGIKPSAASLADVMAATEEASKGIAPPRPALPFKSRNRGIGR